MRRVFNLLVILALLLGLSGNNQPVQAQTEDGPLSRAQALLNTLTPEERVGQLFLVSFKGSDLKPDSPIATLINKYHIGGVMLSAADDNFTGPDGTLNQAYSLISQLQTLEFDTSLTTQRTPTGIAFLPAYVPLFVGISQEGDLAPYDQIINGLTPLPDQMAIGATWKPELAKKVGEVLGQELSALGFNFFLGPSLDVLDLQYSEGNEDLGTRTFGGDPYWVSEMGIAYIQGLHTGANNRMTVIAKHFPGRGSSDRPAEEEVATVRKTLDQMKEVELVPFFAVTNGSLESSQTADGFLVSHIRYQFQGTIRQVTRPVSFERTAMDQLLGLEPIASWRSQGGLVVSDDLGSVAVRKFYDPTQRSFDGRTVARNAFLAGNDLLYINNFLSTGDEDELTSIIRTLDSFAQKYREDDAFAQQVDASVLRLLTMKMRLYPEITLGEVIPAADGLTGIGLSPSVTFDVAQNSVTLISPAASELSTILPRAPVSSERIVFLTDTRESQACSTCTLLSSFSMDALQAVVLRLYGPFAGGQVQPNRVSSYSFGDITRVLNQNAEANPQLELDLQAADWIVVSLLDLPQDRPESQAFKRLLSEKPDLYRNKRVIVFAFNAPYYLDATDISKVTAYYALYSKTPAFIDIAARVLFQEIVPVGALPVSVPGSGYNLGVATSPDPNQVISLQLDLPAEVRPTQTVGTEPTITPEPTQVPLFKVGDILPLRTGLIYDHNHNLVKDGTLVRFVFTTGGAEGGTTQYIESTTLYGVARASFRIQIAGLLEIRVISEPAERSQLLQLDVSTSQAAAITQIVPSQEATQTPTPTQTVTPTPTVTPTELPSQPTGPGFGGWFVSLVAILAMGGLAFWSGNKWVTVRWGVRWGLLAICVGMIFYIYIAAGLPGGDTVISRTGNLGVGLVGLCGALLGWVLGVYWQHWLSRRAKTPANRRINEPK
jgi:beta-N-acetylhexosaminidase